jgi:hypothetical protein
MHSITIAQGIHLAIRKPQSGAELLAKTVAQCFNGAPWINTSIRMQFCILFLGNLIDNHVENDVDTSLLQRLKDKGLLFGIRLLKRNTSASLPILVALIMKELKAVQNFSYKEQMDFYQILERLFFPTPENQSSEHSN